MNSKVLIYTILAFTLIGCQLTSKHTSNMTNSPSKNLTFEVITENGNLFYKVKGLNDTTLIEKSKLGLILNGSDLYIKKIKRENYEVVSESFNINANYANVNSLRNHALYKIVHNTGVFKLEVSSSDKAVAFRYIVENSKHENITVNQELSEFNLPKNGVAWAAEDYEAQWKSHPLNDIDMNAKMTFPVLVENPQQYLLITQAKHHNYSATHLKKNTKYGFKTEFSRLDYDDKNFTLTEDIISPWRVIMVNNSLDGLVNNSFVYELADPVKPELKNAKWIKPGRSGWAWVSGGFLGQNYDNMKNHIEHVAQLGWEYMIIDDGWEHWPNKWKKIKTLTELGQEKGVGIILWKPTGDYQAEWQIKKFGPLPVISGMLDPIARDNLFTKAKDAGVAGFKVDFVNENNLTRVNFFQEVLAHAAHYELVINFHGSNLPTGLERTYPNELTRESVRGMEHVWKDDSLYQLNTILPFTRYVVGHGDYTPVLGVEQKTAGTRTHQLSTAIVFNSPLNAFAVHPKKLLNLPEVELLKDIPTTWDETRVLSGSKIGEIAIIAKRKGKEWYLAVLNGEADNRVNIALNSFLPPGNYHTLIYQDSDEFNGIQKYSTTLASHDQIHKTIKVGGGYVAKFTLNTNNK